MRKTLKEIAQLVKGEVCGGADIVITGISGIKEARKGDITFIADPRYFSLAERTRASAIIVSKELKETAGKPVVRVENPSLAFAKLASAVAANEITHPKGIHPTALTGRNVSLGRNVALGAYVVIENDTAIGDNSVIYAGCFIGHDSRIGSNALIYPNVTIRERAVIGRNVIIHSGTVIGSDGFGFAADEEGRHHKIPQLGIVEIGDDVEIGANVAIDRARFDKTVIGSGTKIDNLVQIAHNVTIGENSLIVAQAGISGSNIIGKGVILAGQAGLSGHITVGDGAIVAARAGVTKSVPAGVMVSGYPAKPHKTAIRVNACVQNLPRLYEAVAELKKKIEQLDGKSGGG